MKRYRAFRALTRPAEPRAELWRLTLGICVVALMTLGLGRAVFAVLHLALEEDAYWDFVADIETASTPAGLLLLLFSLGAMGVGAIAATEIVHRRRARTLFGAAGPFWRQFAAVSAAILALNLVVAALPPWPYAGALEPGLAPLTWLSLLPIALAAILVQTGSEELLFRGYLQSQVAARFAHPAIWLTVPSILFALGHYAPGIYGANAWLIAAWAGLFGLAAADLTARAGTLGPAIAFHLVNNVFAIAVVSLDGEMSGLALFRLPFGPDNGAAIAALLPVEFMMLGLGWLAARVAIAR